MSREILFKAKRKNWRELPKDEWWVEGLPFIQDLDGMEQVCIAHHSISANDYSEICGENKNWFQIDPETLCQYTGLNDNTKWEQLSDDEKKEFLSKRNYKERRMNRKEDWNGKRIWENDIVQCSRREKEAKYKVVWDKTYADFRIEKLNGLGVIPICIEEGNIPVYGRHYEGIGNIFDNPELLGGAE